MKKLILLFLMSLLFQNFISAQGVAVNIIGNSADSSAIFDVSSANKGVLVPRISLNDTADAVTIPNPAHSLVVYNTNTGTGLVESYYYNQGTSLNPHWVQFFPNPANQELNMSGNKIINLATCTNDNDAANKAYVDTQVAGGGGGGGLTMPVMISDQSPATMNFRQALDYCNTLTEGGYTDWYLGSFDEVAYVISTTSYTIPNASSTDVFWMRDRDTGTGYYITVFNISNGHVSRDYGYNPSKARCVR